MAGNILRSFVCALIPDYVGADEKTHKAGVGSCGLRSITDDDPHLLAGTLADEQSDSNS
jgi:hypothetical protein